MTKPKQKKRVRAWEDSVLEAEGLKNWTYKREKGGGLTQLKDKRILYNGTAAMFLHEVAHALTYEDNKPMGDMTGHHVIWGDKFTELVNKYLYIHCSRCTGRALKVRS